MPNFSPIHIPKGELKAHSVYEAFRRISLQLGQHASDLSAVARGESPDGSGNALIDTSGFFFKPGISTGQIAYGGTGPGESLTLSSTRSATKGFIYLGTVAPRLAFDETNCFFGVWTDTPATRLQVNIAAAGTTTTGQTGTALIRGSYGGTSLFDVAPFQFSAGVYDTAIKPIAGVQIVGPDGTAAMRFVQTGSVAYIQTGIISSGGVVTNANMQLGGQGATYGTTVAFAFARAFFAAGNTPTPTQFGVGVNPDSSLGTWKGVMAIVANSATEPALSLFPFNTSAGSVYMELRASTNSTKYMSIDQVASGARIAFYLATTLQGSSQPAISEFGGYKYAILDAHDRRAMTFDSGTLWNDTKTTCLIDIGDTVGGHAGAVMMGIDATTFSRFAIVSSATMLGDQFVGSACPPPRPLVQVRKAGSHSAVVLAITRKSGQTADMTDWWDSDGSTKLAKADSAGNFTMPTVTLVTGAALNKILQSDANGLGSMVAISALGGAAALSRVDDTNVTLTLTGSPTTALLAATTITVGWSGTLSVARGGTGSGTATGSFDALSPLTTLGDTLYHDGTHNVRLGGNTTATRKFLRQTGNGSISAAPPLATILAADIPASALTAGNDTNVTLTTGGSASTALLAAASITAGWTGTLATSRGGTGAASLAAAGIAQLGVGNVFTTIQSITIASNIDALDITAPASKTNPAITLTNSTSGNQVMKADVSSPICVSDLEFMSASTGNTFLVVAKSAIGGIVKTFNICNSNGTRANVVMNQGTPPIPGANTVTWGTPLSTDGGAASHR